MMTPMMKRTMYRIGLLGLAQLLMLSTAPLVWAALDVVEPETTTREVAAAVERLVGETAPRDPELAKLIETEGKDCVADIQDGKLDSEKFTVEVETSRQVERDLTQRVAATEIAAQAEKLAGTAPAAAERLKTVADALARVNEAGELGKVLSREEARTMFEASYRDAVRFDPKAAEQMKELFNVAERGSFDGIRPSLDMAERIQGEMQKYIEANPERAEYCRAEFNNFVERGSDFGERYGQTGSPEQDRAAFEKWAETSGKSAAELDQMRTAMEHGGFEQGAMERAMMEHSGMENAREGFERWAAEGTHDPRELEMAREAMEHYVAERDTSTILDNRVENVPLPSGSGGGTPHVEITPGNWDGNADGIADHTHPLGTAPHS